MWGAYAYRWHSLPAWRQALRALWAGHGVSPGPASSVRQAGATSAPPSDDVDDDSSSSELASLPLDTAGLCRISTLRPRTALAQFISTRKSPTDCDARLQIYSCSLHCCTAETRTEHPICALNWRQGSVAEMSPAGSAAAVIVADVIIADVTAADIICDVTSRPRPLPSARRRLAIFGIALRAARMGRPTCPAGPGHQAAILCRSRRIHLTTNPQPCMQSICLKLTVHPHDSGRISRHLCIVI